jgi:non-specific serine/threonine protein kinase/serine/threonine-protein kinase
MRNDEWLKVEELLNTALELEPGERRKFLDEAATDAPELRREVESLLACEEGADGFLGAPALALSADFFDDGEGDEGRAGQQVGHYRIVREIGRGGMGAVYLAERADGEFRQRVALKVVRRSFADSELARRFRRERQILASLNHPNIARLLDGGVSADGEPFIAMEYVEGARVDDYCAAESLSTDARLRLFLAVCQGVSYAHQHLVIHRDIKPSNILVTAEGVPKLLDFGIAKLLDPEYAGADEHTRTEMRAFTPDYASPEQLAGATVTTASDVYSLGVLLEDLLRGARAKPSARRSPGGWLSRGAGGTVATNLPTDGDGRDGGPKSSTQTFVNSELKNIVAMARREDPARRYSSVVQFAEDVQRYLGGLPVRAQKDSFTYRAGKFVRRNKAGVAAAALVALSLVVGFAVAIWQANVARRERDRAERRFGDVRQLSNALLTDIAPKIERLEGATEARQALVVQSLKYLDSLAEEAEGDLALQAELAAAYEKVGVLQGDSRKPSLSDFRGAIASLEKAQQIRRRLLAINPNDADNRRLLADNLRLLAIRRIAQSDVEGGFRDSKEALRIYESLVAETSGSLELQRAFLETQIEDATNYINLSRFAEAIEPLKQAAIKLEALRKTYADDVEAERILARCLASLGLSLSWETRQQEAEAEMARAVSIAESLASRYPNDTNVKQDLWKIYESASSIYEEVDDARAYELCDKARKVVESVIAVDRANAQARHNLSKIFSRLGISASNIGQPAAALDFLERAKAIILELQEKDPLNRGYDRDLSALYIRIGVARLKQRDYNGALAAYEKSAELYEKQIANDAANTIAMRDSAIAYRHAGSVHRELAKTANGQTRQLHLAAEIESYQKALNALLKAQAQKALPEINLKLLENIRKDIEELEKQVERQ